jgi:adenosylcobinamide-GDP ribazoletransferase
VSALTNLGDTGLVTIVLIAAHAAGRAPIAAFMRLVPPARTDGMSADAGRPSQGSAMAALLLGLVPLMMALEFAAGVVAVVLLAVGFGFMAWLCKRQIGGQTGDVLGALEQTGEIVVLLVAAAAANTLR